MKYELKQSGLNMGMQEMLVDWALSLGAYLHYQNTFFLLIIKKIFI